MAGASKGEDQKMVQSEGDYVLFLLFLGEIVSSNVTKQLVQIFEYVQNPQFLQSHLFDTDLLDIPICWDSQ